ncbi:hypothetical protein HF675_05170 [Serratia sp. JUb9]|uniref:hypothetical protein n=1 Tax=Serratia sp. JUb9 TaxID=2724469 RepID=UPI00164E3301|nr:hypothetical protein [Serratia sp. JUb9]QNK33452.1 hypothetical protein HF675_05170 [Serratia sp. JUb9]
MDKKKIETEKQRVYRSKTKIPPSWQLYEAQRAFIEDLWQDDAPEAEAPRPVKKDSP